MSEKDNKYWKSRFDKYLSGLDKDEAALKRKLIGQTKEIAAELEKEIASFYSRFGVDNILEYKNLTRGLSRADYNLLMRDIASFSKKYPEYAHLIDIRKGAYKLSRLEGLHHSVLMKQVEIGAMQQEEIERYLTEVYKGARITSLEALGVSDTFYKVDEITMKQTVNKAWLDSSNFSDRIWSNTQKLTKTIQNEITNGFIRGDSYQKLASVLADKMGNNVSNAMRLIRTEGTFVANEAAMEPFEAMEDIVDEYIYSSVLDKRTSDICKALDGEKFKIKDKQPGVNFPPMHVYCRSSFEIDIPEDFVDRYEAKMLKTIDKRTKKGYDALYRKVEEEEPQFEYISERRIKKVAKKFLKRGGKIHQSEEIDRILDIQQASAATFDDKTIFLRTKATISDLREELYHAEQYRKDLIKDSSKIVILKAEIEAQEYLIANKSKYKIPDIEHEQTKKNLERYRDELKNELKKHGKR